MFLESHSWQPFGPHRFVAAKPHKGSAIRAATVGGTGIWPPLHCTANAESELDTKSAIKRQCFIVKLRF
jgi:hypothetical protein